MTSILKADNIQDADGNNIINESGNTITIGASGDTTNIIGTLQNNGAAVGGTNTPAFRAYLSSNQTINDATDTVVSLDSEDYDTDSAFDTSNYRFTVPSGEAGKYFFYAQAFFKELTSPAQLRLRIRKNTSTIIAAVSYKHLTLPTIDLV